MGDLSLQLFRPRRELSGGRDPAGQPVGLVVGGREEEHRVVRCEPFAPDRVRIHLMEVGDRTAAERLAGAFVAVDAAHLPALLTDPFDRYLGATVTDPEGRVLGVVNDVRDNGAHPILFLDEDLLIPAVPPLIVELRSGTLIADLPDGFLEMNAEDLERER
jgi:ribosomal 30S subunit maturation factor RimM